MDDAIAKWYQQCDQLAANTREACELLIRIDMALRDDLDLRERLGVQIANRVRDCVDSRTVLNKALFGHLS